MTDIPRLDHHPRQLDAPTRLAAVQVQQAVTLGTQLAWVSIELALRGLDNTFTDTRSEL